MWKQIGLRVGHTGSVASAAPLPFPLAPDSAGRPPSSAFFRLRRPKTFGLEHPLSMKKYSERWVLKYVACSEDTKLAMQACSSKKKFDFELG